MDLWSGLSVYARDCGLVAGLALGEGGFGEDGELRGRPVEPEIAEDAAEQDDVAEVAAADDEDVRGVGGQAGGHRK